MCGFSAARFAEQMQSLLTFCPWKMQSRLRVIVLSHAGVGFGRGGVGSICQWRSPASCTAGAKAQGLQTVPGRSWQQHARHHHPYHHHQHLRCLSSSRTAKHASIDRTNTHHVCNEVASCFLILMKQVHTAKWKTPRRTRRGHRDFKKGQT